MPNVVVRVERFTVIRGEGSTLLLIAHCHGQTAALALTDRADLGESSIRTFVLKDWED